jgi:Mrp family chromosome partitioning ATPase
LLDQADLRKLKTLLITSAESGEGKTTVAINVAWLLANQHVRRVLLIDASPSPSVGRSLGIDAKRGWLDVIEGSCELKNALIRLDPKGLYVMMRGALNAHSGETLPNRLRGLIAELSARFDLVVVDSSAILESFESRLLAEALDGTVIVARAGHTHRNKVTAARKLVPKGRRLGLVLNQSEAGVDTARRSREKKSLVGRLLGRRM